MHITSARNRVHLTILPLLFCAAAAGAAAGERPAPVAADIEKVSLVGQWAAKAYDGGEFGWAASTSGRYDARYYALDLRVDPSDSTISGSVLMRFASVVDDLETVVLDLHGDLGVDSVRVGDTAVTFSHEADSLSIDLPSALAAEQVDSVRVWYSGTPPYEGYGLGFGAYAEGDWSSPVIANLSEPAYAQYWWPCKDRPDDKALTRVSITAPAGLTAVSNGEFVEAVTAAGWTTTTWRTLHPIATYLVSVAVADYVTVHDDGCAITPLRNWVFVPTLERAEEDLDRLCEMMEFMETVAGPYPFADEKYGHAEFLWGGAMEHQSVTSYSFFFFTGGHHYDTIMVHELAHQWFGDSLSPRNWADIWLNEGFATYCEALWAESEAGRDGYLWYLNSGFHRDDDLWRGAGPVHDPVPVFPGRVIYDKGAWILHMLRCRMGDAAFFALLMEWATGEERVYADVVTAEFVALASSHAGEDLEAFFEPWLTTDAVPEVGMSWYVTDGPRGAGTRLTATLVQRQATLFDNVYPLLVHTAAGDTTVHLRLATPTASAGFDLAGSVTDVDLDPETSVLWDEVAGPATRSSVLSVSPNPVFESHVDIALSLEGAADVTVEIYDLRGRLMVARPAVTVVPDAGGASVSWNCRDNDGRRVPSGVYWADLRIDGRRHVAKFTVLN